VLLTPTVPGVADVDDAAFNPVRSSVAFSARLAVTLLFPPPRNVPPAAVVTVKLPPPAITNLVNWAQPWEPDDCHITSEVNVLVGATVIVFVLSVVPIEFTVSEVTELFWFTFSVPERLVVSP